jgi:hypothetical protein
MSGTQTLELNGTHLVLYAAYTTDNCLIIATLGLTPVRPFTLNIVGIYSENVHA